MLYLSPLLLCISLNLLILKIISSLNMQKISLNKSSIISISIFLTIASFVSMEFGKFINLYLLQSYGTTFGGVLILFIGLNYLTEHTKIVEYKNGYDTSFYYETFSKYRQYFITPNIIDNNNSKYIEINESIYISIPLSLFAFFMFFAAGTTSCNIPFTLFTVFISTALVLCTSFLKKLHVLNTFLNNHCLFIISIILIINGIFVIFL